MSLERVNPWVRADEERTNPDTESLIPEGLHPEYHRIMKELAHAKEIANLALERVYIAERKREDFFAYLESAYKGAQIINLEDYRDGVEDVPA